MLGNLRIPVGDLLKEKAQQQAEKKTLVITLPGSEKKESTHQPGTDQRTGNDYWTQVKQKASQYPLATFLAGAITGGLLIAVTRKPSSGLSGTPGRHKPKAGRSGGKARRKRKSK